MPSGRVLIDCFAFDWLYDDKTENKQDRRQSIFDIWASLYQVKDLLESQYHKGVSLDSWDFVSAGTLCLSERYYVYQAVASCLSNSQLSKKRLLILQLHHCFYKQMIKLILVRRGKNHNFVYDCMCTLCECGARREIELYTFLAYPIVMLRNIWEEMRTSCFK